MDGKNSGLISGIRTFIIGVWGIFSVFFFGFLALLFGPVGMGISRRFEQLWVHALLGVSGIKVEVVGFRKLDPKKRYVFIANHQSHIDIPVLFRGLRQHVSFIAKKELFRIPVFGWAMYVLGHVWIDRGNPRKALKSIEVAVNRLKKDNISIALFPEGTRSKDGTLGRFKQGSFALVQRAGVQVVPLVIENTAKLFPKHSLTIYSGMVHLTICDPITVQPDQSKSEISEMIHSIIAGILENKEKRPQ
jgi:1-acyl-sn-glycerol-3-phosphate acyltransferase